MDTPPPFLTRAPADVAGWVALFDPQKLPVLAETAEAIEEWRQHEDDVDAHLLAQTLMRDPLMTLKLFAHVAAVTRHRGREGTRGEVETVTAALVMMGIGPFFRQFGQQPVAQDWLARHPGALEGFTSVLQRSNRAAAFAMGFAAHRGDHDAPVIHEAALLHDFAEMLLWLRAPAWAQEIAARQADDPTLRSAEVQRSLLNVELIDLQHALMLAWRLPSMLVRITDDRHAEDPQVRNVVLAIRVARHSARGWDNAALPDDVHDIAELLQLGEVPVRRLLRDIDDEC